jgi:hypothetical protein
MNYLLALIALASGLALGAVAGALVVAFFTGGRITDLETENTELRERCESYVDELDAVVKATQPDAQGDYIPATTEEH